MTNYCYSEVDINISLVKQLLAEQFPQWAKLPLEPINSAGTDNAIYRLGDEMAVRLPRFSRVADDVEKEYQWLPRLAPFLPLAIPVPLGKGTPAAGYPWPWSIYRWIEGENATIEHIADLRQVAIAIGQFIAVLQRIDPAGGPLSGRGVPLIMQDSDTRAAIITLQDVIDAGAATAAWEAALHAPMWHCLPVWLHGDLHSGNLLVNHGRLSAVIDFGLLGVGDPACDLMVGWTLLSAETRKIFRTALPVDDATWERGRGWALSWGLIALAYYLNSNPVLANIAQYTIDQVLELHSE